MIRRFICAGDLRKRIHRGEIAEHRERDSDVGGTSTSDTQAFKRAIDMTDDELAAIVAKLRGSPRQSSDPKVHLRW